MSVVHDSYIQAPLWYCLPFVLTTTDTWEFLQDQSFLLSYHGLVPETITGYVHLAWVSDLWVSLYITDDELLVPWMSQDAN